MNKKILFILFLLVCLFYTGCNKQSMSLDYKGSKVVEDIDGYSRDMFLQNDTLFVVSEQDGLLIYKMNGSVEPSPISLELQYSDSLAFESKNWNLSYIEYSQSLHSLIVLDKFYSIQTAALLDFYTNANNVQFEKSCCNADSHHPSTFIINNNDDIFALIRNKSGQEGIPTDVVSIYKISYNKIGDIIFPDSPVEVVDSLIYDVTDIYYRNNTLFVSNTSYDNFQFSVYQDNNSSLELNATISTPYKPVTLYGNDEYLFVGMANHGGMKIYNNSLEEVSWNAKGFSIRDIYWDSSSGKLFLSCGYQGVVIFELDNAMNITNSWLLNTSYAYTSRYYDKNVLVATREGVEIFNIE